MTDTPYVPPSMPIEITAGANGLPCITAENASRMLRAIANSVESHTDIGHAEIAFAIRMEADALDCRAIAHTTGPK